MFQTPTFLDITFISFVINFILSLNIETVQPTFLNQMHVLSGKDGGFRHLPKINKYTEKVLILMNIFILYKCGSKNYTPNKHICT